MSLVVGSGLSIKYTRFAAILDAISRRSGVLSQHFRTLESLLAFRSDPTASPPTCIERRSKYLLKSSHTFC